MKRKAREVVYVCSPYAGVIDKNVSNARKYSRFVLTKRKIPLTPHLLYPQFMDDTNPNERKVAFSINKVLLGKCEELWVFGRNITAGMRLEINLARGRGLLLKWFDENLQEVQAQ